MSEDNKTKSFIEAVIAAVFAGGFVLGVLTAAFGTAFMVLEMVQAAKGALPWQHFAG